MAGKGVDVVLTDPYTFPFDTASVDIILSSSCFEHSEMFWLVFLEIMRVLKPKGLFYLNAPSNGNFHRYPVDCWRFYPDSGRALATWANRNSINSALLESYTSSQAKDTWNDFVAVFLKDENYASEFPGRIIDRKRDITNGLIYGSNDFINKSRKTEDQKAFSVFHKLKIKLKKPR
ncbi:MAG: methyltransferase domain-containing protein [Desulfobacteraceae bacterium]|jgi:SAM-dependent methyltransferase